MALIENTRTSRITGPDSIPDPAKATEANPRPRKAFPGGVVIIQPAEIRGEGRETKILPTRTELTNERLDHALRDRSLRKLFKAGVLHVIDPKGNRVPWPKDEEDEGWHEAFSAPVAAPVVVTQKLDAVTEDEARELLKRYPHLVTPPAAAPVAATTDTKVDDAPAQAQPNANQRPQGNGNQRR